MRLVVGEDQALLREGLVRLFRDAGHEVVAAVGDGDRVRGAVSEHAPDLAVVDVRMPPTFTDEGLRAARWIRDAHPEVGVLGALAARRRRRGRRPGLAVGLRLPAQGQGAGRRRFHHRLGAGGVRWIVLDPKVVETLLAGEGDPDPEGAISRQARRCSGSMAEGLSNAGIAARLVLTERTVESHVRGVLAKLDVPAQDDGHRLVLAVLSYLGVQPR